MQQDENGGEEEATVDVQFTDLPNALIACKVPEDLFNEGSLKVRIYTLCTFWICAERRSRALGFVKHIKQCCVTYVLLQFCKEAQNCLIFDRGLAF